MNSEPTASPRRGSWRVAIVLAGLATLAATGAVLTRSPASIPTTVSQAATTGAQVPGAEFNDSHFHLTNDVQKGIDVRQYPDLLRGRRHLDARLESADRRHEPEGSHRQL